MIRFLAIGLVIAFQFAPTTTATPPKVIITSPDNGEVDVSPDIKEIRVEFDQPMDPDGRSIVGGGDQLPEISGQIHWQSPTVCIIPVKLQANHEYWLSINSDTFKGFANIHGEPADMYPISFKTRAGNSAPAASDVTLEQNKHALAALKKAIDDDYSYRDRKSIDWSTETAARQSEFENAKTANAFARVTAHLLRLADDPHVAVSAGDLHIYTCPNSTPPNFNFQTLQQKVPHWNQLDSGIITGRFDENAAGAKGVGYILFSDCTKQQADGFDAALGQLADTEALIIDARMNGGGDEPAAQRVAGRFVEAPTVYSKDRIREHGRWTGLIDRQVKPREDAKRYKNPVVVLIGPKIVSSAESFALMMRYGAKAQLIGQTTRGSSGRPVPHDLGNGVTIFLPSWEDAFPDDSPLEGHGVKPDIFIKTTPNQLENTDPTLNAALSCLGHPGAAK